MRTARLLDDLLGARNAGATFFRRREVIEVEAGQLNAHGFAQGRAREAELGRFRPLYFDDRNQMQQVADILDPHIGAVRDQLCTPPNLPSIGENQAFLGLNIIKIGCKT